MPPRSAPNRATRLSRAARPTNPPQPKRPQSSITRPRPARPKRTARTRHQHALQQAASSPHLDRPVSDVSKLSPKPTLLHKPSPQENMTPAAPPELHSHGHNNPLKKRYLRAWDPSPIDQNSKQKDPSISASLSASGSASGSATASASLSGSTGTGASPGAPHVTRKRKYPKLIVEDLQGNIVPNPLISSSLSTAPEKSHPKEGVKEQSIRKRNSGDDLKVAELPSRTPVIPLPQNIEDNVMIQELSDPLPVMPFQQYASSDRDALQLQQADQPVLQQPHSPLRRSLLRREQPPIHIPSLSLELAQPSTKPQLHTAHPKPVQQPASKVPFPSNLPSQPIPSSHQNISHPIFQPSANCTNIATANRSRVLPQEQMNRVFQLPQIQQTQPLQNEYDSQHAPMVDSLQKMEQIRIMQPQNAQSAEHVQRIQPQNEQSETDPIQSVQFMRPSHHPHITPRPLFYAQPQQRVGMAQCSTLPPHSTHEVHSNMQPIPHQQRKIQPRPVPESDQNLRPNYEAPNPNLGVKSSEPVQTESKKRKSTDSAERGSSGEQIADSGASNEEKVIQAGKRCGTVQYWRSSLQMPKLGSMPKRKKYTRAGAAEGRARKKGTGKGASTSHDVKNGEKESKCQAEAVPESFATTSNDMHKFWRSATKLPRNNPDRARMRKLAEGKRKAPAGGGRLTPEKRASGKDRYNEKQGNRPSIPIIPKEPVGEAEIEKHIDEERFEMIQRKIEAEQRLAQQRLLNEVCSSAEDELKGKRESKGCEVKMGVDRSSM